MFPWIVCFSYLVKPSDKAVMMITKVIDEFCMAIWIDPRFVNCGIVCILWWFFYCIGDSNIRGDDASNAVREEVT